ncbi:MAG: amidohydrolase family protein, partial [Acidobacteria bacterium]|nr:amidohydrolase family protein [Acidobacteriota bacterium]
MKCSFFCIAALLLVCIFNSSLSFSQQSTQRMTVIRAGRMLDVRTGSMINNVVILIDGDRIKEIGPNIAIPPNAEVIDLGQKTILPGLIDCHTHLTFDPGNIGASFLATSIPREALRGAKNAKITLEAGFTTVRNVGARGYSDVA